MKFNKRKIKKDFLKVICSIECGKVDLSDISSLDYEVVGITISDEYGIDILS